MSAAPLHTFTTEASGVTMVNRAAHLPQLSEWQQQVISMGCDGLTAVAIASHMGVKPSVIHATNHDSYRALNVSGFKAARDHVTQSVGQDARKNFMVAGKEVVNHAVRFTQLTWDQQRILTLITEKQSAKEISTALDISLKRVLKEKTAIYKSLGVNDFAQAALLVKAVATTTAAPDAQTTLSNHALIENRATHLSQLTEMQQILLTLDAEGNDRKTMARRLGVGVTAVAVHRAAIYETLDITDRLQTIRFVAPAPKRHPATLAIKDRLNINQIALAKLYIDLKPQQEIAEILGIDMKALQLRTMAINKKFGFHSYVRLAAVLQGYNKDDLRQLGSPRKVHTVAAARTTSRPERPTEWKPLSQSMNIWATSIAATM